MERCVKDWLATPLLVDIHPVLLGVAGQVTAV